MENQTPKNQKIKNLIKYILLMLQLVVIIIIYIAFNLDFTPFVAVVIIISFLVSLYGFMSLAWFLAFINEEETFLHAFIEQQKEKFKTPLDVVYALLFVLFLPSTLFVIEDPLHLFKNVKNIGMFQISYILMGVALINGLFILRRVKSGDDRYGSKKFWILYFTLSILAFLLLFFNFFNSLTE